MRAGRAEGTARAAQGAACATEAGSPRAPATATAMCWMTAGYAQALICEDKSTHLAFCFLIATLSYTVLPTR
jgi:hypothetical protein